MENRGQTLNESGNSPVGSSAASEMINTDVNDKIMMIMVGILQSAAWLSNVADEPTLAKGLIKAEIIEFELADVRGCKAIAKKHGIDLDKVWKGERF